MSKNPRDRYGPPLEDSKQKRVTDTGIIGTAKQVLQSPASDSKQVITYPSSSNRFTPLQLQPVTPLLTPRMSMQLQPLPSSSSKALQQTYTPLQTQRPTTPRPTKNPEKLPFYTPPTQEPCPFVRKPYKLPLFTLEPDYCQDNGSLLQTIAKRYPPKFHYEPKAPEKSRNFYEFILVDTESTDLTHQYEANDPTKITFSKFKILKVITPSQWRSHPSVAKSFTRKFTPQQYTYYDYMDVWHFMLYHEPYNHTSFI